MAENKEGSYQFTKESQAKDRAKEIGGFYEGFDSDGDGENDVWNVFQKQTDEGITSGRRREHLVLKVKAPLALKRMQK